MKAPKRSTKRAWEGYGPAMVRPCAPTRYLGAGMSTGWPSDLNDLAQRGQVVERAPEEPWRKFFHNQSAYVSKRPKCLNCAGFGHRWIERSTPEGGFEMPLKRTCEFCKGSGLQRAST